MSPIASLPADSLPLQENAWTLRAVHEVASTNSACQNLPPWTALRADIQTGGRGRTGRHWVSDEGGLWLSAVLPCPGPREKWAILPLAIGWAVIAGLQEMGVAGLRLRWPNDLMIGRRKLAGLLVDRFNATDAVVGIGVNVFNQPETAEPGLAGATVRLAELASGSYTLDSVARVILRGIGRAHASIEAGEFHRIAAALNTHWAQPRLVAVTLTGREETFTGHFHGIDDTGRLRLRTDRHGIRCYDPAQIDLLRELE
jgi:BirA family biotin operon repressor/biotin-[acetyl-CoA-carboxylase] ligase